jgi:hypothetical protein
MLRVTDTVVHTKKNRIGQGSCAKIAADILLGDVAAEICFWETYGSYLGLKDIKTYVKSEQFRIIELL